jgi:hypothetical protein
MSKFIICLVSYGDVLLLRVVSLMDGSTTSVPMSPGYGGYQTTTLPSYYTKTTYATTGCCTTKAPEFTPELVMPQATTPTPRATLPKSLSTTPRRPSTTPLRHQNPTRLRMLNPAYYTEAPNWTTTTLKSPSTTLQPTLPRDFTLRKRSRKKKKSSKRREKRRLKSVV